MERKPVLPPNQTSLMGASECSVCVSAEEGELERGKDAAPWRMTPRGCASGPVILGPLYAFELAIAQGIVTVVDGSLQKSCAGMHVTMIVDFSEGSFLAAEGRRWWHPAYSTSPSPSHTTRRTRGARSTQGCRAYRRIARCPLVGRRRCAAVS